jgi:hypothetical protein
MYNINVNNSRPLKTNRNYTYKYFNLKLTLLYRKLGVKSLSILKVLILNKPLNI